ncbi:hypothetical protein [Stenotrophomonas indicatrix]|uniref:hypothetical protein n=1 Tax=Stenotrophomonas indicatrix TaxID=2045451 RepID=UPI00111A3E8A|nr:hypothetical protein [Stenotrophomonas indicatrix]
MAARAEGIADIRAAAADMIIQHPGWRKSSQERIVERLTERTDITLQRAGDIAASKAIPAYSRAFPRCNGGCGGPMQHFRTSKSRHRIVRQLIVFVCR